MSDAGSKTSKWFNSLYIACRELLLKKLSALNRILLVILIIVATAGVARKYLISSPSSVAYVNGVLEALQRNANHIENVTSILKDIATSFGILVAGIWTYYVFVRGRTLHPKLNIEVRHLFFGGPNAQYAVIRCIVKNVGNTRILPHKASAKVYHEELINGDVFYVNLSEQDNLLESYKYKENDYLGTQVGRWC